MRGTARGWAAVLVAAGVSGTAVVALLVVLLILVID